MRQLRYIYLLQKRNKEKIRKQYIYSKTIRNINYVINITVEISISIAEVTRKQKKK